MKQTKPFYKSKTFWLAILGFAHAAYQIFVEKNVDAGWTSAGASAAILTARFSNDTNTGQ